MGRGPQPAAALLPGHRAPCVAHPSTQTQRGAPAETGTPLCDPGPEHRAVCRSTLVQTRQAPVMWYVVSTAGEGAAPGEDVFRSKVLATVLYQTLNAWRPQRPMLPRRRDQSSPG
jgi:hypothetical protein